MKGPVLLSMSCLLASCKLSAQPVSRPGPGVQPLLVARGQSVRIVTRTETYEGRFGGYRNDSLLVRRDAGDAAIAADAVLAAFAKRRQTRRGAVVGAVAGVVIGGTAAALALGPGCRQSNAFSCSDARVMGSLIGGVAFGLTGSGLGAAIGFPIKRWTRVV